MASLFYRKQTRTIENPTMQMNQLSHPQRVRLLYKTILRLHRGLPTELRALGDNYVRDEFRRHLKCNPMEAQLFMTEWARYASTITQQLGLRGKPKGEIGEHLDEKAVEMLKDDQVVQLYELMLATKGLHGDTITADDVRGK